MLALLDTHSRIKEKIGVGIEIIKIAKVKYNNKCFEIIRIDGSTEYFSYIRLINSPMTDFAKFNRACRDIIAEDMRIVKKSLNLGRTFQARIKRQNKDLKIE